MKLDKFLISAGFIGPAIFFLTIYFLFALMYPGYDPINNYISSLGAVDSPIKTLANVLGFSLFGIMIMLFAYGILRSVELNIGAKIAAIFFFVTGVLMFLVGIFVCDPGCNNFSVRGDLHIKVSDYQFPVLAVGLVLFALSVTRNKDLRILTPIILILGLLTLALAYLFFFAGPLPHGGILQRAAIGLPYLIMMIIAIKLYRTQKFNQNI